MSNKSRWRGYPREEWHDGAPIPGIDYDPGREGSPYTFEGQMGRLQNEIGSLMSPDPEFRRKAQFRYLVFAIPLTVVPLVVVIIALVQSAHH